MWILRNEKIGDSSGGVSSACCIKGGLREKIIDAGRELGPPLGPELSGDSSVGGDGVSGGVCHRGESVGVTVTGVTSDFLCSLLELLLDPPKLDINERTGITQGSQ